MDTSPFAEHAARNIVQALAEKAGFTGTPDCAVNVVAWAIEEEVQIVLTSSLTSIRYWNEAQEKVEENRRLVKEQARVAAMDRLREVLAIYPYSKADVLSSWEVDQCRRVMDS